MTTTHLPDGPIEVFFTGGGRAGTIDAIRALEVDAVLRSARGLDPGKLTFEPDRMMVRYTAQVYVKEQDWHPTDLRSAPGS